MSSHRAIRFRGKNRSGHAYALPKQKTIDRKKEAREKDSRGKKLRENLLGVICAESNSFVRPTS